MGRTPHNEHALRILVCHPFGNNEVVNDLCRRLQSDGFEPWLYEESLSPGRDPHNEVGKVLRRSNVIIVCLSSRSTLQRGYAREEIDFVLDSADKQPNGTPYIIPLRLDNCEVPDRLKRWHWVDFFGGRGYRRLKKALFQASQKVRGPRIRTEANLNQAPNPLGDPKKYRFPPGIVVASTKKPRDLMPGRHSKEYEQLVQDSVVGNFILVPARPLLEMYTNDSLRLVRNPVEHVEGKINTWIGITTVGADAFKIENGLLDPNILRRRLKRAALLFDQIAIYDLIPSLSVIGQNDLTNELTWLLEQDIICQPEVDDREYSGLSEEYLSIQEHSQNNFGRNLIAIADVVSTLNKARTKDARKACFRVVAETLDNMMWWQIRSAALWFGEVYGAHLVPILENPPAQVLRPRAEFSKELLAFIKSGFFARGEREGRERASGAGANKGEVIQIILKSLPLPGDDTSWEDLINYKNDTDVRYNLLALRNWANEAARLELPPIELADKLEWLIAQYQTHVKIHRMKFESGTAELILTTTASALEELVHFRFGKLAQILFGFKRSKLALLEAEINAPGSEVAYILSTVREFQ